MLKITYFWMGKKYSYHWQDADGSLITRWDNSPHYREVALFPHHKHLRNSVVESKERTFKDILKIIRDTIHNQFDIMF